MCQYTVYSFIQKDGKSVYWHIRITNKITHNETPETLSHSAQSDPFFFISSIGAVIFYRFVPVYVTPLMIIRSVKQLVSGEKVVCKHTWVPFDKISPSLPMAVIASEDNRFASHNGFDMIEIKKAMKENETRKRNGVPVPSASRQRKTSFFGHNLRGYEKDLRSTLHF